MMEILDGIGKIIVDFLSEKSLPGSMQYISMALLTVMIPLGIVLLDKREDKVLDRYVFLDHIVNMGYFSWALVGLTVPFLFWEYIGTIGAAAWRNAIWCVLFCGWMFAILFVAKAFGKIYRWLKKKNIQEYMAYLASIRSKEDGLIVWGEIWKKKDENWANEEKFFSIYSKYIERYAKADTAYVIDLLRTFEQFIQSRNLFLLAVHPEVFPQILEWHFLAWKREQTELARVLDSIIKRIEERILLEDKAYYFFNHLEKHLGKYADAKKTEVYTYYYVDTLQLQASFFENVSQSKEFSEIKNHYFPAEWKISTKNIAERKKISQTWSESFMDWFNERINNLQEERDKSANGVIETLFPGIHMQYFPYILTFIFRSWMGDYRMESLIEKPPRFGGYYNYKLLNTSGKNDDDLEKERNEDYNKAKMYTIELSVQLFHLYFRGIKKCLQDLEALERNYRNDEKKEYLRKELFDVFSLIEKEMDKRQNRSK